MTEWLVQAAVLLSPHDFIILVILCKMQRSATNCCQWHSKITSLIRLTIVRHRGTTDDSVRLWTAWSIKLTDQDGHYNELLTDDYTPATPAVHLIQRFLVSVSLSAILRDVRQMRWNGSDFARLKCKKRSVKLNEYRNWFTSRNSFRDNDDCLTMRNLSDGIHTSRCHESSRLVLSSRRVTGIHLITSKCWAISIRKSDLRLVNAWQMVMQSRALSKETFNINAML